MARLSFRVESDSGSTMARPSNPSVLAAPKLAQSESSNSDPLCQVQAVEQLDVTPGEAEGSAALSPSAAMPQSGSEPPPSATTVSVGFPRAVASGETPGEEISKVVRAQPSNASSGLQPRKVATPPRPSAQASAKPPTEAAPTYRTTIVQAAAKHSQRSPSSPRACQSVAQKLQGSASARDRGAGSTRAKVESSRAAARAKPSSEQAAVSSATISPNSLSQLKKSNESNDLHDRRRVPPVSRVQHRAGL